MESNNVSLFLILWCVSFLLTRVGLSRMFKAAGESPWLAWLPIFSWWYWIKIVGRPKWYILGMITPGINILFSFNITLDILRSFGKFGYWQQFLGTVFSFIYFPVLAFSPLTFIGPAGKKSWRESHVPKNNGIREWGDAILFAAYVAGGMRALFFDLYQIPTPSMESNLMVGDYLVVSRAKIGMRIPMTPITVPVLAPKEILGMKAYSDWLELPYMRLPGWYSIQNNDIIVFNWPADGDEFPTDKKDNYVKRCIGIPGDRIRISKGVVYINGKELPRVGKQQKRYLALMSEPITEDFLAENDLGDFQFPYDAEKYIADGRRMGKDVIPYTLFTWPENIEKIKQNSSVFSIRLDTIDRGYDRNLFPDTTTTKYFKSRWDLNNYGEFYLPKRGETLVLTKENWDWLSLAINKYEESYISEQEGKFYSRNGIEIKTYTFKMGYYWMMGDNRYNSLDSRYWGYVPEDHIVGKPLFTFFSLKKVIGIDPETYMPLSEHGNMEYKTRGIRWRKILRWIE